MENTKACFKCGTVQPLSAYYKHKQMADGHLNKCKKCTKLDVRKREEDLKKDPEWVEKEKERARDKYYRLHYNEKSKIANKDKKAAVSGYFTRYPEKKRAKNLSSNIRKKGYHKHHWSYAEGLEKDIIWLNIKEHNYLHRYLVYDQERQLYRCTRKTKSFSTGDLLDSKYRHIRYYLELKKIIKN